MPFYDTPPAFLEEAVASVCLQTESRWELLLVDDGSVPPLSSFAKQLAAGDERISYYEHADHANRGAGASRNLGIELAKGKFIAFLDSDDVWLPGKLGEQIALLETNSAAGMLYGNTQYWRTWRNDGATNQKDYLPRLKHVANATYQPPELLIKFLRGGAPMPSMNSIIIRKKVIDQAGGFLDDFKTVYEDQIFIARACLATPVHVSDAVWDRYRQREDSSYSTAVRTGEDRAARIAYLRWLSDYVSAHFPNHRKLNQAISQAVSAANSTSALAPGSLRQLLRRMTRKARWRISPENR